MVVTQGHEIDAHVVQRREDDGRGLQQESLCWIRTRVRELAHHGLEVDRRHVRCSHDGRHVAHDGAGTLVGGRDRRISASDRFLVTATHHDVAAELERQPLRTTRTDSTEQLHDDCAICGIDDERFRYVVSGIDRAGHGLVDLQLACAWDLDRLAVADRIHHRVVNRRATLVDHRDSH